MLDTILTTSYLNAKCLRRQSNKQIQLYAFKVFTVSFTILYLIFHLPFTFILSVIFTFHTRGLIFISIDLLLKYCVFVIFIVKIIFDKLIHLDITAAKLCTALRNKKALFAYFTQYDCFTRRAQLISFNDLEVCFALKSRHWR